MHVIVVRAGTGLNLSLVLVGRYCCCTRETKKFFPNPILFPDTSEV